MRAFLAAAAVSAFLAGCAGSTDVTPMGPQASIPFADYYGTIRDFHAVNDDTVYLQTGNRRWYRADLLGPCIGLPFANGIGVDTGPTGRLDRFGTIIVEGQRCKITSLTPTEAPRQS